MTNDDTVRCRLLQDVKFNTTPRYFFNIFFLQLSIVSGSMTDKLAIVRRKFLLPFLFDDFK